MGGQPQLTGLIVVIVIGAGALHATWNAIAKDISDRLMAFALIGVALTAGGAVALGLAGLPPGKAVLLAIISAAIHIAYEAGLMASYRLGSFNQVYPIARGTSPLLVALGAAVFAHEHLAAGALAGVAILAAGLMSLALSAGWPSRAELPAIGVALLTGVTIASYTVVDGIGVRAAHDPYSYTGLLFVLQGPPFLIAALARRPAAAWRDARLVSRGLLAGALAALAYGVVLWAQARAPMAEVAAIREVSVVFAALIGMVFFRERFGTRRVAAAIVIAVGIILISA